MAKKMTGESPVDEAYLRSLMAGTPVEPAAAPPAKTEATNVTMDEAETSIEREVPEERPLPKSLKTALTDFIRRFLTPYKCESRQGVYIDRELHQKISVIVGIAGKRQLTVGNYIDNVLREHFEKHSDEVKTYCQKSYNKIF